MSVSSSLASIPSFDKNGLDPAQVSLTRLRQLIGLLDNTLRLPSTPRAFSIYLLGLVIIFAGAFLHVLVAAQIMQAEFTLGQLQAEYDAVEQQNGDIIFRIARATNMAELHEQVLAQGYVPVQKREYIFIPEEMTAMTPAAETTLPTDEATSSDVATVAAAATAETTVANEQPVIIARTTNLGGQFARWEEFWSRTWRSSFGGASAAPSITTESAANPASNPKPDSGASAAQPSQAPINFWSVWWEKASEQGSKLIDQFRSQ
jgi:hypothetical protein